MRLLYHRDTLQLYQLKFQAVSQLGSNLERFSAISQTPSKLSDRNRRARQMATALTLRGFNDLGCSVIPIFLSMGRFLCRFYTFCEKMKKIYRVEF